MESRSLGIVRQIDPLGRIVIPKETRDLLGIAVEDPLEFFSDNKQIMLRKYRASSCLFCQSAEQLHYFKGQLICRTCMREAITSRYPEVDANIREETAPYALQSQRSDSTSSPHPLDSSEYSPYTASWPASTDRLEQSSESNPASEPQQLLQQRNATSAKLVQLMDILEQEPHLKQRELASRLQISQGRVSQLIRLMKRL